MTDDHNPGCPRANATPARRQLLHGVLATGTALTVPGCTATNRLEGSQRSRAGAGHRGDGKLAALDLTAATGTTRLVPDARPKTRVWAYNDAVPGPTIRLKQGDTLDVNFRNALRESTTVHWHGIRLPNNMDGVPHLTQKPVRPASAFRYRFKARDAGTYWYHPHLGIPEQIGRGLYGALIIDESDPPDVDRDITWIVDDWRLDGQAQIFNDFYKWSDVAFAGRVGNTVTVNGMEHYREPVSAGDRIRLRLINAANARLVSLNFGNLPVWIMALDGNPLPKAKRLAPADNVFLGPGQRADVIVDIPGNSAAEIPINDRFRPRRSYPVAWLKVSRGSSPGSRSERGAPGPLPPNALAEPSGRDRLPVRIDLSGGMMGVSVPWTERAASRVRRWAGSREAGAHWALNGKAHMTHRSKDGFEFTASLGQTVEITYHNHTGIWHPMHLHGHMFRELSRNDQPIPMSPWRDTTMVSPRERLKLAFVADNPGDWLIHCHVLEHHAGGMGTQFRVTG